MQTFLPYADFARSAAVLDMPRLGKQRVETLQILRALALPDYGWAKHPAVLMWRGYHSALVVYGLVVVDVWTALGHTDSTRTLIAEFAPEARDWDQAALTARDLLPHWLGDERLHRSHQSALLRKDPERYGPLFPGVPDDLPYWWPEPREADRPAPEEGPLLWVVRPASPATLGTFLDRGVVGLGGASGIAADASGCDTPALRELLAQRAPRRRPGKDLRQLDAFLNDLKPGDQVGVPIEQGEALLVGEITSGYRFAGGRGDGDLCHRRAVRWQGRLPRSAVNPPAALQDPRALFAVRLRPER